MTKKRAMITVDADKWDRLQVKLKEAGYAPSAMSDYIGVLLDELELFLDEGEGSGCPPYMALLVQRYGLTIALRKFGYHMVRDQEDPDFPEDDN